LLAALLWCSPLWGGVLEYRPADVPKAIPDLGTVRSTVQVQENGTIVDLDVKLTIRHTFDADLDVFLLAPDGRRVELFTDVGGSGNDFLDTILSDDATLPITGGSPPFTGRYRPEGSLDSLSVMDMKGTWTLEVTDDANGDTGTIESWSLMIQCDPIPSPWANPCPADGAFCVPVDTVLSWGAPAFRLLGGTGSDGLNPFSLVELQTDPVKEGLVGPAGDNLGLDFAPDGRLYGAGSSLRIINPTDGSFATICPRSPTGSYILMSSIAFHPNGTLYGVGLLDKYLYTVDTATCFATTVGPISGATVWCIDFAPDGTLYGAFANLVTLDPGSGRVLRIIGPIKCLDTQVYVNDIDFAPDGQIYAVHFESKMLYKIDPVDPSHATGFGPYDSELWGVASEVTCGTGRVGAMGLTLGGLAPSGNAHAATLELASLESGPAVGEALSDAVRDEQILRDKSRHLVDQHTAQSHIEKEAQGDDTLSLFSMSSEPRAAALAPAGSTTYDVFLDTVNPPQRRICHDIQARSCDPGTLNSSMRYYWQVVARTASGETQGPVWSFTTATCTLVFEDTFPTSSLDTSKWTYRYGSPTVDTDAVGEPSAPYSLHLGSYDQVQSRTLDLLGVDCAVLTYQWQRSSTESGDDLYVDFWDGQTWQALATHLANEGQADVFTKERSILPRTALHSAFRLRFRAHCDSRWDDWFIDDIRLRACRCVEDFETGDLSRLPWTCSGDAPWTVVKDQDNPVNYSARPVSINHNQTSCLEITMDCEPGAITFDRKVSSEASYDKLAFYMNGAKNGEWSGSLNWATVSFAVPAGQNTFKWAYSKDGSVSSGSDTAWIDNVHLPIATSVCPTCSQ